jgi:YHS domain-containing protein
MTNRSVRGGSYFASRHPRALAVSARQRRQQSVPAMAKAIDPVCKMTVDDEKAAGHSEHQGHTYFFCSKICKQKFDQDPGRYAGK